MQGGARGIRSNPRGNSRSTPVPVRQALDRIARSCIGPCSSYTAYDDLIFTNKDVLGKLLEEKARVCEPILELVHATVEAHQKVWLSGSSTLVGLIHCLLQALSAVQLDVTSLRLCLNLFRHIWETTCESMAVGALQLTEPRQIPKPTPQAQRFSQTHGVDDANDDVDWFFSDTPEALPSVRHDEQQRNPDPKPETSETDDLLHWFSICLQHALAEDTASPTFASGPPTVGVPMSLAADVARSLHLFTDIGTSKHSTFSDSQMFKRMEAFEHVAVLPVLGANTSVSRVYSNSVPLPPLDSITLSQLLVGGRDNNGIYHAVACVEAALLVPKQTASSTVQVTTIWSTSLQLETFHRSESDYACRVTDHLCNKVNADLIFCAGTVDLGVRSSLEQRKVQILESVDLATLKSVSFVSGARIKSTVWDLHHTDCGDQVRVQFVEGGFSHDPESRFVKHNARKHAGAVGLVRGLICAQRHDSSSCSVILAAPTSCVFADLEVRFWACLQRLVCLHMYGQVLPGGGAVEIVCACESERLAGILELLYAREEEHNHDSMDTLVLLDELGLPLQWSSIFDQDYISVSDMLDLSVGLKACSKALELFVGYLYDGMQWVDTSSTWGRMCEAFARRISNSRAQPTILGLKQPNVWHTINSWNVQLKLEPLCHLQTLGLSCPHVHGSPTYVLDVPCVKIASMRAALALVATITSVSAQVWV